MAMLYGRHSLFSGAAWCSLEQVGAVWNRLEQLIATRRHLMQVGTACTAWCSLVEIGTVGLT